LYLQVAQEINSEAKFQNDFLNQLVLFPSFLIIIMDSLYTTVSGIMFWVDTRFGLDCF
jgi:hypothetical protein